MVSAQEYLDKHYPKETRGSIAELDIKNKELEGHLDLSDFVNLKKFNCKKNQLTSIDLSKNINLVNLALHDNQLTSIDLSKNPKLRHISLYYNNFSANLSIFSLLTNLKFLDLGLAPKDLSASLPNNNFSGSLKSLENCKNLEHLCIGLQPNIKEGLEYLPAENLTHFGCHGTVFEEILEPYGVRKSGSEALKKWKNTPENERKNIEKKVQNKSKRDEVLRELENYKTKTKTNENKELAEEIERLEGEVNKANDFIEVYKANLEEFSKLETELETKKYRNF